MSVSRCCLATAAGFSLLEVVFAGVISTLVAVGTMAAFVTAARMTQVQNNPGTAEATGHARDTIERFRNMMACDAGQWFSGANCTPNLPAGWVADAIPGGGGSESITNGVTKRCYRAQSADCDGDAVVGDCISLEVRVCWKDLTNCPC